MSESKKNKIEDFFASYQNTIKVLSGLIIALTFLITADNYINNQIEDKITDETYMDKLSKVLRPFSIFDINGTIIYDHGGESFIQEITVQKNSNREIKHINIKTKSFLQTAPILIYVGYGNYAYTSKKTSTYMWEYDLASYSVLTPPSATSQLSQFFMVEVVP